ncbi:MULTISPECIES: amino acid ABC transporter permease [Chelatococcus]|uniref:Polar amino acid transport system permease protein n=1 Tax=Chelatococcus caeni TaxID=1348468 RepID=A0A840BVM3_9HYPH|nr:MULTISPECIES: amino acid ABC transporter permease [Chelatococcus]ALA18611.1 polar amino acid ABC transporter permease [Chelatococcus sp. CO-6]MBB4015752.1 polar amino acid transport system permease protein [Chelatococcus caeni]
MRDFTTTFLNFDILREVWPLLAEGLWLTATLALVAVPLAVLCGLLVALAQEARSPVLRGIIVAYVDVMRAIPPLVLLIFIFYGLPFLGLQLGEFSAAVLALTLNGSSYFAEIFRAGLESVPRGQREAARSTGLTWGQSMTYVVVPQGTRNVLPDLVSNTVELVKQTSIASAVALQELLRSAQIAQGLTYNPTPLIAAAIIYFLMFWPFVRLVSRLQNRTAAA